MKFMPILAASAIALSLQTRAENVVYNLDGSHADIGFSVRHMVVSTTRGAFGKVTGTLTTDDKGVLIAAEAVIPVASVDTKEAKRDEHLRGEDFFDAKNNPDITFKSTAVKKTAAGKYEVTGDLKMRDVTKSVTLPVDLNGPVTDPYGNIRIGFETTTTINRQDWNIKYNGLLGSGDKAIGDDVKINVSVEGIKAK